MKFKALWHLSISTSTEAEEAVVELAQRLFGLPPSVFHSQETAATVVSVYAARKTSVAPRRLKILAAGFKKLQQCGLNPGPGTIEVRKIRREGWAESWKKHFKPLEISRTLLIKPSWSKRRSRRNQAVVILDPGLSFGTGQHPTTEFCLKQLVAARRPEQAQSFLDIGAGSGILAIAAAKLAYQPVAAFDSDPEAVRAARSNAERNGVLQKIHLVRRDLRRLALAPHSKYDVICANLVLDLLLRERSRIVGRLKEGGRLILAGILENQFAEVQEHYRVAGLILISVESGREWKSGAFVLSSVGPS